MKWGVRRYQNRDGSLTAKGKKRYAKDGGSGETAKQKVIKKPPVKRLSMEELQEKQNRLQLEKRVLELENDIRKLTMPQVAETPQATKGKSAVKEMLGKKTTELMGEGYEAVGKWALGKVLERAGIKAGADEMEMLKKDAEKWKNKADILRNKQFVDDYNNPKKREADAWRTESETWKNKAETARSRQAVDEYNTSQTKEAKDAKKKMDDMKYQNEYSRNKWQSAKYERDYRDIVKDMNDKKEPDIINMKQEGERWVSNFLNIDPDLKPRKTY